MALDHTASKQKHTDVKESLGVRIFIYAYGLFTWVLYLTLAIIGGAYFKRTDHKLLSKLAVAQDAFWNLSKQPVPGFNHAFHKSRSGYKLHYICNRDSARPGPASDLVVFIHGFPDSSVMWRLLLQEPTLPVKSAAMICVDMPGYGGSDSLEKYDTRVLDILTEFVVAMREKYTLSKDGGVEGKTYIVAHDWGCVVAYRLAAEAPSLADRFILSNAPHIELTKANIVRITQSSTKIFRQFRSAPQKNIACLGKIYHILKPLFKQTLLSGYIFAFHLPGFMVKYLGSGGNMFFLLSVGQSEHGKSPSDFRPAESLASTIGPSPAECASKTPRSGETYGASVRARAQSHGESFIHTTGYYRDGLSLDPWVKSIETITDLYNPENEMSSSDSPHRRRSSSASSTLFTEQYKGSLRAPATILWGQDDLALSKPICIDGIGDYLAKGSEVIELPRSGHWTALEPESRLVYAHILKLLVDKSKPTPDYFLDDVKGVYEGAHLMVRR